MEVHYDMHMNCFKTYREVVFEAIKQNGWALDLIDESVKMI